MLSSQVFLSWCPCDAGRSLQCCAPSRASSIPFLIVDHPPVISLTTPWHVFILSLWWPQACVFNFRVSWSSPGESRSTRYPPNSSLSMLAHGFPGRPGVFIYLMLSALHLLEMWSSQSFWSTGGNFPSFQGCIIFLKHLPLFSWDLGMEGEAWTEESDWHAASETKTGRSDNSAALMRNWCVERCDLPLKDTGSQSQGRKHTVFSTQTERCWFKIHQRPWTGGLFKMYHMKTGLWKIHLTFI